MPTSWLFSVELIGTIFFSFPPAFFPLVTAGELLGHRVDNQREEGGGCSFKWQAGLVDVIIAQAGNSIPGPGHCVCTLFD